MKKLVSGELVDMTAEEIALQETDKTNEENRKAQAQTDKETNDALKASAKTKLMNGEALTEDEANVMVGL
jgi:hypothetical protein